MESQTCTCCHETKTLDNFTLQADGRYRKQCRKCKNDTNRRGRTPRLVVLERSSPKPQVDPQLLVMVGAALRMWKGPVDGGRVLRWAA